MPVSFSKPDPHTVIIHGGPVRLHFARMQVGQFAEFDTMFMAIAGGRLTPVRPDLTTPSADELRTRLLEDATDARKHADWMAGVIGEYVTVASGDLTVDGEVVTSGQRFVEVMAGHPDVLNEVLVSLWLAHKLTAEQKKTLQSLRDSGTGSTSASRTATAGRKRATAAASAGVGGSAPAVGVTASSNGASSGMTGPAPSSGSVRSSSSRRKRTTSSRCSGAAMQKSSSVSAG